MIAEKHSRTNQRNRSWTLALTWGALGLAAGLVLLALAGPTPVARAAGSQAPTAAEVAAPRATVPYTTVVDVQMATPQSLDPQWMYDTTSAGVAMQVYETLLTYRRADPDVLVPQLATGWDVSAGADVYTFAIRAGVHFHAGGTLQAHDVAYSLWRGLIQDRTDGPAWMWFDALFESGPGMDYLPGDDLAKCQAVKDAITYDDAARTVTFHLPRAYAPLLNLLTTPFASILDQEWMATNGGWGGSCSNWRNYHDPAAEDSILYHQMNGTGPFRLDHWTAGEVGLARYDGYWRQTPAWPGGPTGPAALERVLIKYVADAATRRDMLLAGWADLADVDAADYAALEPAIWGIYDGYADRDPVLVDPAGTLRLYQNLPYMLATPAMFNYNITPGGNPYIGSGALDGDGIPPDFFADLHVRKAFNYAMDWAAFIAQEFDGEALRSRGPIPKGMLGYTDTQAVYAYDPGLSEQEFQLAWGGDVWTQGFSMTIAYNTDNTARQGVAEILAENVEAVNPAFHVNVIGMPWEDLLADRRDGLLPIYVGGWLEDFHHPSNWVDPFLSSTGAYAHVQNFPPALADQFDAKIDECLALGDPAAARTCYEALQNLSYVNAAAAWGYQLVQRRYIRTEVRGYYANPATSLAPYYYALSKGAPPTTAPADPGVDNTLVFTSTAGATTTVDIPTGALSETSEIVFTPNTVVEDTQPGGLRLGGMTFDLQVCQDGECFSSYTFDNLVLLTLHYTDADVAGLIESELYLYTWNGAEWVDVVADCGLPPTAYERHPEINELGVPVCHFSQFAMVSSTFNACLPVILH